MRAQRRCSEVVQDPNWLTSPDKAVWRDAVCAAAFNEHLETVKILLAEGPGVQAQQFTPAFCERVIREMINGRHEETLRTLLDFLDTLPQFRAQWRKTEWCSDNGCGKKGRRGVLEGAQ